MASLVLLATPTYARAAELPGKLQAAIFLKVFAYSTSLKESGPVRVLVVSDGAAASAVHQALRDSKIESTLVDPGSAIRQLSNCNVVYLPRADAAVSARALELGKLTLSGDADHVRAGGAAIGLELRDGRPKIVVNLARLRAENHKLSSKVLGLAEVVR